MQLSLHTISFPPNNRFNKSGFYDAWTSIAKLKFGCDLPRKRLFVLWKRKKNVWTNNNSKVNLKTSAQLSPSCSALLTRQLFPACSSPSFHLVYGRPVGRRYQVFTVMTPLLNNEHEWSDKARTRQPADPLKSSGQNANCWAFSCADAQTPNFTDAAAYQYLIGQDAITCVYERICNLH